MTPKPTNPTKKTPRRKRPAAQAGVHPEHEDDPWTIDVADHAKRTDSPLYVRSRALMIEIVKQTQPWFFGDHPYQDHHGGGLWVKDTEGWLLVLLPAGIEWSAQFCADPTKVEQLRRFAARLINAFPETLPAYEKLGYHDAAKILSTPISDATGVANWTDSIFNASVPLPPDKHTGVLPSGAGYHHYPKPIVDIEFVKRDDFQLFVTDSQGQQVAVTPASSNPKDKRVRIVWAHPDSKFAAGFERGDVEILEPQHPVAKQAFARWAPTK
jgi:hypothetical protein